MERQKESSNTATSQAVKVEALSAWSWWGGLEGWSQEFLKFRGGPNSELPKHQYNTRFERVDEVKLSNCTTVAYSVFDQFSSLLLLSMTLHHDNRSPI